MRAPAGRLRLLPTEDQTPPSGWRTRVRGDSTGCSASARGQATGGRAGRGWPLRGPHDEACGGPGGTRYGVGELGVSLGAGRWALGAGRWALGAGRWALGAGRWALGAGRWALGAGRWALGAGRWALGAGRWALGAGRWALGAGRWALGAGRWALGAGRWAIIASSPRAPDVKLFLVPRTNVCTI